MKIISGFVALLVLAVVLCFALSNTAVVELSMWPLGTTVQAPLSVVALVPLGLGLLVGGLWGWLAAIPHRLRVRRLSRENVDLRGKLGSMHQNQDLAPSPLSLRARWRARRS